MSQSSTSSQASQRSFPSAFPTTQETFCVPPCFSNSQHLPRPYLLSFCCVPRLYQPTPLLLLFCRAVPSCRRRFRGAVLQTHHSHAIYLSVSLSLSLSQYEYTNKLEGISIHRRDPNFTELAMPKMLHHPLFSLQGAEPCSHTSCSFASLNMCVTIQQIVRQESIDRCHVM